MLATSARRAVRQNDFASGMGRGLGSRPRTGGIRTSTHVYLRPESQSVRVLAPSRARGPRLGRPRLALIRVAGHDVALLRRRERADGHGDGLHRAVDIGRLHAETQRETSAEGDELCEVEKHTPQLHAPSRLRNATTAAVTDRRSDPRASSRRTRAGHGPRRSAASASVAVSRYESRGSARATGRNAESSECAQGDSNTRPSDS